MAYLSGMASNAMTEAQKQSFEANGFTMYTFHANSGCCPHCQALDGQHFQVKDMMPGTNAAPLHPNCRCFVSAYEDSEEYEAWLDYLDKGGSTAEWKKQKKLLAIGRYDGIITKGTFADNFDRKARVYKLEEDLEAVNPKFSTGEYKWLNNCQRCVPTYEMRRRGYRVTAKPIPTQAADDVLAQMFELAWTRRDSQLCLSKNPQQEIKAQMSTWGNGARVEVFVAWPNGSGHVFVAEQRNGETIFFDPQSPAADASKYLEKAVTGSVKFLRIDNNSPSGYILDCCENER